MARITSTIQDVLMMYVWEDDLQHELTSTKQIINHSMHKLFDFDYPFYSDSLKEDFQKEFIRHFYMREIGSESIALFKMRLEDYLYLSYPKWTLLYESLTEDFRPFVNFDVKTNRNVDEIEKNDKLTKREEIENQNNEANRIDSQKFDRNETIDSSQNVVNDTQTDDFSRSIDTETPDERLEITVNDGVGAVDYASHITETRGTNETNQESDTTTHRETTSLENQDLDRKDTEQRNKTFDRDDSENSNRELEQILVERKSGKIGNVSYLTMYDEFIKRYEGINKQMFKEMNYLFITLLN